MVFHETVHYFYYHNIYVHETVKYFYDHKVLFLLFDCLLTALLRPADLLHNTLWAFVRSNMLTTKKQTTKFSSVNFQKMLNPSYIILRIQT